MKERQREIKIEKQRGRQRGRDKDEEISKEERERDEDKDEEISKEEKGQLLRMNFFFFVLFLYIFRLVRYLTFLSLSLII